VGDTGGAFDLEVESVGRSGHQIASGGVPFGSVVLEHFLEHAGDGFDHRQWVVDLMRHTGGHLADGGQPFRAHQVRLELQPGGDVAADPHDLHGIAVRIVDGGQGDIADERIGVLVLEDDLVLGGVSLGQRQGEHLLLDVGLGEQNTHRLTAQRPGFVAEALFEHPVDGEQAAVRVGQEDQVAAVLHYPFQQLLGLRQLFVLGQEFLFAVVQFRRVRDEPEQPY